MAERYDSTSFGGSDSQFQTTEWSKILNSSVGESILGELYVKYWKPVYSYLRRKGFNNDQAKDIIQGFFSEKVLGQQLLQKADKTKGKFRTFLLTAIKNYAIDIHRRYKPLQKLDEVIEKPSNINEPEIEFDIVWAKELLHSVLNELEAECKSRNKNTHWQIFREWLIEPDNSNTKAGMSEICSRYGVKDTSTAYYMISNLKERFRIILRRQLRPHVDSDTQVDDEIRYFINIFSEKTAR